VLAISIEMPGGSVSKPRSHTLHCEWVTLNGRSFRLVSKGKDFDEDLIAKELHHLSAIMRSWPDFEAYICILEDGVRISREHIKT